MKRYKSQAVIPDDFSKGIYPMTSPAIEAKALSKTITTRTGLWKNKTKSTLAADGVTFTVKRGELFTVALKECVPFHFDPNISTTKSQNRRTRR